MTLTGFAMFQDRLLYFPEKIAAAKVVSDWLGAWPTANEFRGLVATPAGDAGGTVIVFHGNAGHAGQRGYYAAVLTVLGLRVILAEYPGYGPREGRMSEQSLVSDAEQTIIRAYSLHGGPLLIIGESLGAAIAAAAGARQRDKIAGLILVTPWDRLMSVAAYHFPWLPVRWLLRDHYDSATHLAAFERPILVAVAEHDNIVPARFGRALYGSLIARKQLKVMSDAGHNDWKEQVDLDWWREAVQFLLGMESEATQH
jgi:pimeloyl-ACP methyl ester carboxylesterase